MTAKDPLLVYSLILPGFGIISHIICQAVFNSFKNIAVLYDDIAFSYISSNFQVFIALHSQLQSNQFWRRGTPPYTLYVLTVNGLWGCVIPWVGNHTGEKSCVFSDMSDIAIFDYNCVCWKSYSIFLMTMNYSPVWWWCIFRDVLDTVLPVFGWRESGKHQLNFIKNWTWDLMNIK
jgi:hypothetical protein